MESDPGLREDIQRLRRRFGENPRGLVFARLADLYRRAGDRQTALEILEEGMERHPNYLSAHIVRARVLREAGELQRAERAFRTVLELDSQNLVALEALADLAHARGDRGEARRWYRRLLQVDPGNPEARQGLEALELESEGGAKAADRPDAEDGQEAAERPELADAEASAKEAERTRSGASAEEAAKLRARLEELRLHEEDESREGGEAGDLATGTLAELYVRQGLYGEAVEMYRELLRRRPDDGELKRRLEEARAELRSAGDEAESDVSFRRHLRALLRGEAGPSVDSSDPAPAAREAVGGGAE